MLNLIKYFDYSISFSKSLHIQVGQRLAFVHFFGLVG